MPLASLTQGEQPWLSRSWQPLARPRDQWVLWWHFAPTVLRWAAFQVAALREDLIARLLAGEFAGPQVYLTEYGVSARG